MWHQIERVEILNDGAISARIQVAADSTWFKGHFPDAPVLPGVAQLAMVREALEAALKRPVHLQQIARVRFKHLIRPDETITLIITPTGMRGLDYSFRLWAAQELALTGSLTMAPLSSSQF